jgi:hypothetical protein
MAETKEIPLENPILLSLALALAFGTTAVTALASVYYPTPNPDLATALAFVRDHPFVTGGAISLFFYSYLKSWTVILH